jgi:hypothetical protein
MTRSNYELTHPVLSIRVSQELNDEIQKRRKNGQSYGDILRIGLDRQKAATEHWQERVEGLELEVLETEELVEKRTIKYPCYVCNRPLVVESEQEKEVCRQALRGRFRHRTCL